VREDGPDVRTLGEVIAYAFGVRGQDYSRAEWDSWRGEDGKWVIALGWHAGRSENSAHWSFAPGAHGGTVNALDEHAEELLDPHRAPRTLRAVEPEVIEQAGPPRAEQRGDDSRPAETVEAKPKAKKNHPVVPAWEDVLLGVRSQRG
jgi:hypothetical protein